MTQAGVNENAQVNYVDGQFYTITGNTPVSLWDYQYYQQHWNPSYYNTTPNKFEQAYKVAVVLQEKKLIDIKTIKQFIELIDELQKVL